MPIPYAFGPSWRRAAISAAALIAGLPGLAVWPQPVAAAASPPVLTIVSTASWTEPKQIQALHVVGEVRNDDAIQTAQNVMLDCRLLDASGTVKLAEEIQPADAAVLLPGEKSPFDVVFISPPSYDHYGCSVKGTATLAQPDHNFDKKITSVTTDPNGHQVVSGTVKNLNTVAVSYALLFFTFYKNATDNPPQTVAEGQLWVNDGFPLAAGSVTPFTLTRFQPPASSGTSAPYWNGVAAALLVEAPTPAVSFTPSSVSVTQVKTTTSGVQLVSLVNVGTGDLHVSALTLDGAHPLEWTESDTCAGAVPPFGSCTISLTFRPADVGDRSATLRIDDDANMTPQILVLTGTGTNPMAAPSPSPLVFDPQVVGTRSADRPLAVNNPGIGDLHVGTVTLSGPNAGDFTISSNGCTNATVPQGLSCGLLVNFRPSGLGPRTATLTITDDALDSPQPVTLTGIGAASQTAFDPPSRAFSFGNQKIATTSAPTSVTITNKGTSTLTVTSVCSSAPAEFNVAAGGCLPGFSLAPGFLNAIPITFTPAMTGVRTSTLTFTDNAPDSPQLVTLSGTGTFGGQYHPLAPARIYDSRGGAGALGPGLQGAPARTVPVTGVGGVRANAIAVVLNVTVTDTTDSSFLTVYPTGVTRPTASNLNWVAGQTVPNLVEVAVGTGGAVDVYNALGSADVIFDVAGYVTAEADMPGPAGFFNPVAPARVLDTRNAIGAPSAPVAAGNQIDVQLAGAGGVPAGGVAAVVLNVTVTDATAPSFLTVFPTGVSPPVISNLNFVAGQTVPNRVIVKVGSSGKVSFYNAAGTVNVIADVGGWFSDATPGGTGAGFNPMTPTRILDTRNGVGGFQAPLGQAPIALTVSGVAGIPGSGSPTPPTALVLNVTVANPTAPSFLTLWPDGTARPNASDLNFLAGQVTSNLVVVKVTPQVDLGHAFQKVWKLAIFNAAGTTDVIIDLVGWYS